MCEPTTIMAVTAVVGAAFTANQQVKQGKFQKATSEYNSRVAENEAEETRNAGVEQENIQRRKTAELLSKQRAQLGAGNIDLTSGSALQLQEETVALGEADALRIRSNFQDRADALDTGAALTRSEGDFAESAGKGNAAGTILGGVSSAAGASAIGAGGSGVADKWFTPQSAALSQGQSVLGTSTIPSF